MPSLLNSPLDLIALRKAARDEVVAALDSVSSESKALVLDPALSGPLGLVAEVREFKEHGVEKIYHLLPEPLATECRDVVYIVRPQLELMEQIAQQVLQLEREDARAKSKSRRSYTLFLLPRRSMVCEKVLQDEGVLELLTVREVGVQLIPLEDDVLSLELPCFRECWLDGDPSALHTVATSVMKLQAMFGTIPTVRGVGEKAEAVVEQIKTMRKILAADGLLPADDDYPPEIGALLIVDRAADLVTPLCTELTYEGLIHGVFGIKHGYIDVEPAVVGLPPAADGRRVKREMNNNDELYAQVRSLNFGELGPLLKKLARGVHEGYEERHAAHTVSQIRDFMKKLGQLQNLHKSLSAHVGLAGRIQQHTSAPAFHKRLECEQLALASGAISAEAEAYVEELIAEGAPLPSVLRLLCLLSVVGNGLRPKALASAQAELLAQYGYDKIAMTLGPLQRLGLLKRNDGRSTWPTLKKALRLVVDDLPEYEAGAEPADMAYVYAGYAPLSVRIVAAMARRDWREETRRNDGLKALPGPLVDHDQGADADGAAAPPPPPPPPAPPPSAAATGDGAAAADGVATGAAAPPPVTLVYFVGGVTFAEIAAVRWLARHEGRPFVVATTDVISGDAFMGSLVHTLENGLRSTNG